MTVYALVDVEAKVIGYIGRSVYAPGRYEDHITAAKLQAYAPYTCVMSSVAQWLRFLIHEGRLPELWILPRHYEELPYHDLRFYRNDDIEEQLWIRDMVNADVVLSNRMYPHIKLPPGYGERCPYPACRVHYPAHDDSPTPDIEKRVPSQGYQYQ